MSEQEKSFIERAEIILCEIEKSREELKKTKSWWTGAAITFFLATIAMIGSVTLNNYRINALELAIDQTASRKGVELLRQSYDAEQKAFVNLLRIDYQKAALEFHEDCKKINDNIFFYSMSVTRGGNNTSSETTKNSFQ